MIKHFEYKDKKPKKRLKKIVLFFVFVIVLFFVWLLVFVLSVTSDLPDPAQFAELPKAQSTKIYDRDAEILLYEIHGEEKRTIIPDSEIPDYLKKAAILIEDKNFYSHPAYDLKGIIRAAAVNLLRGEIVQGGSTITQQLIKNVFLSPERTFTRKIKEFVLAVNIEKKYSKDDILNFYLNQIPYGENSYGVEAAAQTYFGKSAKDMTIAECALLAAIAKAPSYYSPYGSHKEELMERKNFILKKMREDNILDDYEYEKALSYEIKFLPQDKGIKAPHFVMLVKEYLENKYGEQFVHKSGLKVITTLDFKTQQLAEEVIKKGAERNTELYQGKNAAMVVQDAKTGQILALVGSKDYFNIDQDGNFNVAVQGLRQPGSSFKPFAYLTAFQKGYTQDTIVFDLPTEFDTTGNPQQSYKPKNFDEKFRGPVTLKNALAQSINIPAVKVLYLAGIQNTILNAQKMGISTLTDPSRYGLSLVLGGGAVKLIDMVKAYSVFSQEGILREQSFILKVEDASGKTLEKYNDKFQETVEPELAKTINDILSDNKARAPLFGNRLNNPVFIEGHTVAAKTGTSDDYKDAWIIGYTPSYVLGIWAGNNDNSPMVKKAGSILAAVPIWQDFMSKFLEGMPDEKFSAPQNKLSPKNMLNGKYVVNFTAKDTNNEPANYPQIHNILWYVDKNNPTGDRPLNPGLNPQFWNWEAPVLNWVQTLKKNNLDLSNINQPLPPSSQEEIQVIPDVLNPLTSTSSLFEIINPQNGAFISAPRYVEGFGEASPLEISLKNEGVIQILNIYWNDEIIKSLENIPTGEQVIILEIPEEKITLQNKIVIEGKNNDDVYKEELILYKQIQN